MQKDRIQQVQRKPEGLNIKGRKFFPGASALAFLKDTVAFPFSEGDTVCWKECEADGTLKMRRGVVRNVRFVLDGNVNGGCVKVDGVYYTYGNADETHFRVEVDGNKAPSTSYVFTKHNISGLSGLRTVITEKIKKTDIYDK